MNESDSWKTEDQSVWQEKDGKIMPNPFLMKIWKATALVRYDDQDKWLQVAHDLGYVAGIYDEKSKTILYEPTKFEYDPESARNSLNLPANGPLIFKNIEGNRSYKQLWDWLLAPKRLEHGNQNSSDMG